MNSEKKIPQICTNSPEFEAPKGRTMGIGFWNSYVKSAEYQALQPENRLISPEELAAHNTRESMWIALQNGSKAEVYDVTPFAEYHPGGYNLIAQYAGMDATEPFRRAHAYISLKMISRLKKGQLVASSRPKVIPNFLTPTMNTLTISRPLQAMRVISKPKWDWESSTQDSRVFLKIDLRKPLSSPIPSYNLVATAKPDAQESHRTILQISVLLDDEYYLFKIKLIPQLKPNLNCIRFEPDCWSGTKNPLVIMDLMNTEETTPRKQYSAIGSVIRDELVKIPGLSPPDEFLECAVESSGRVGPSSYQHIRVVVPSDQAHLPIAPLSHIFVAVKDADSQVRPYTPTGMLTGESNTSKVDLLVKVYPDGRVSKLLDEVKAGVKLKISLPQCRFSPRVLFKPSVFESDKVEPWGAICMVCGGSGVTPFLYLIDHFVINNLDKLPKTKFFLLWFNSKVDDVIYRERLAAASSNHRLRVDYWLSDSEETMVSSNDDSNVTFGRLGDSKSSRYVENCVKVDRGDILCLVCGPPAFNLAATRLCKEPWQVPAANVLTL